MRAALRIGIRDLLWLALLAAVICTWGMEHRRNAAKIRRSRMESLFLRIKGQFEPSDAELKRKQAVARMRWLSDDGLDGCLRAILQSSEYWRHVDYEPCLVEMARRRLAERLQKHCELLMRSHPSEPSILRYAHNLELLTALRRAQGKSDPLKLEVLLDSRPRWALDHPGPCLQVVVKNCDVEKESVHFFDGGDDRGGRRERWRFVLRDEQGRSVRDSNYCPMMGGGVGGFGPLKYDEAANRFNFFDLRRYLAPPPTGNYQLQAIYHNSVGIASEPDVSGLIVTTSEPVPVVIENRTPAVASPKRVHVGPVLAVFAAGGALFGASWFSRSLARQRGADGRGGNHLSLTRDILWAALVTGVTLMMSVDQYRQTSQMIDLRPDAQADWSIRPQAD